MWRNFLALQELVLREIARDLQEASQLSEPDFAVLARLAEAPEHVMRSTELARALGWDTGRMSHQLRRMEQRGLVARCRGTDTDGRAALISLTDNGLDAYRRSLGPHWRSIQRWFLDGIDPGRLDQFDDALAALLTHLQQQQNHDAKEQQ